MAQFNRNKAAVTIIDVAQRAGVSPKTVSNVVNNRPVVRPATRERVQAVIQELDYRPSAAARSLVTRRRRLIGFLLADITNPAYPEMVEAIASNTQQSGYMLLLCNTRRDPVEEDRYVNLLIEQQVDGVIISSSSAESHVGEILARHGIHVVLFNRHPREFTANYVGVDNDLGGYLATRHLIALGHRRIAFIRGESGASTSQEREAGFRRALQESGMPVDERLLVFGDFRVGKSREVTMELLSGSERPTAVFAANDVMALAVIDVALRLGLRVPEDLAVVGFDDISIASISSVGLTTVRSNFRKMAEVAICLLLDLIQDPNHPGHRNPIRKTLPVTLLVRRTCGGKTAERLIGQSRLLSANTD